MVEILNVRTMGTTTGRDRVYVGRGTPWGNPFRMRTEADRLDVCRRFQEYAIERLRREPHWLDELRGKDLVCHCAPKRCHAEVLRVLANR